MSFKHFLRPEPLRETYVISGLKQSNVIPIISNVHQETDEWANWRMGVHGEMQGTYPSPKLSTPIGTL